ncbi:MAG TPA: hypothetical protein VL991_10565 [Terracidiphilus sp.]|nr:hypothetical protein [Terracidiphilus sp.]
MGTGKRQPKQKALGSVADEPQIEPSGTESAENEDGLESLRSAAHRQLGKNSNKIAETLGKRAAEGDLNSAKFLVAVVKENAGKASRKKRPGPSAVERLLLEPVWEEPLESDEKPEPAQ